VFEGVAQEVHVTSLPDGLGQDLGDALAQAGVVVGDDELHAGKTALPQTGQEVAPAGIALACRCLDPKHAAIALVVDADGDQHRLRTDHAALADTLVAGVADEVGVGLLEAPRGELLKALIEAGVDAADRRGLKKEWPQSSSVMARTLRVETPCTYISARAATRRLLGA